MPHTETRITVLEGTVKTHAKEIDEMKRSSRDLRNAIYQRMEQIKDDMHAMALSSQRMANDNQKWMFRVTIGFVFQIVIGIILIYVKLGVAPQ